MRFFALFMLFTGILCVHAARVLALTCPEMPEQTSPKSQTKVRAAVARIGPVTGGELFTKVESEATNLLANMPNSDKVYLQQMMYAAYCSSLRDDSSKSESEKGKLIADYNVAVLGIKLPDVKDFTVLWRCIPTYLHPPGVNTADNEPEKDILDKSLYWISSHYSTNSTDCLNKLLIAGASPNASYPTDNDGSRLFNAPPLSWALWSHRWNDVKLLLENGADPMRRAQNGETPMHWAAEVCVADDMLELLFAKGGQIDGPKVEGSAPINYAWYHKCPGRWEKLYSNK